MQPLQDAYASLNARAGDQALGEGVRLLAPENRDEARRHLLKLLNRKEFVMTVFMARKLFFNGIILMEDLNFFMTSVSIALKNGHSDVISN